MKELYHREITLQALSGYFCSDALETIIAANLGQDALRYQIGHNYIHYDSNSFAAGDAHCQELRLAVLAALQRRDRLSARESLGRLTHTVQDLYAHSNYVELWREIHPDAPSNEIEPEINELLSDARLHSGKLYYPLEAFSFIVAIKPYVVPLLPHDSHAWMNIDDPSRPNFDYAFAAAVKRTEAEYLRLVGQLPAQELVLLTGGNN
jgi:hypothetical protein